MSFFVFGPDNMSRTQLEAFERSCREWIETPPELTTPDLPVARQRTAGETAAPTSNADAPATERPERTEELVTPTPSQPARRHRRSAVSRMRRALLERSRGRVGAP